MIYPNDKSTVFSIVPFAIDEFKPGIYPGWFKIPGCLDDRKPQTLVIGASEHLMVVGGKKQPIRIETPSYQIAKAVVDDFLDGQLYTTPEAKPGICWLQGHVLIDQFLRDHTDKYQQMLANQKRWFINTVQKTDDDWKKFKNSRVVTDTARFAVRALGLTIPEWMSIEEVSMNFVTCPACSTKNNPENIVCSGCKVLFTSALMKAKTREEKLAAFALK